MSCCQNNPYAHLLGPTVDQLGGICHRAPYLRFPAAFTAAILLARHPPLSPFVEADAVTDAFVGLIQSPLVPAEELL